MKNKTILFTAILFILQACGSKKNTENKATEILDNTTVTLTEAQLKNASIKLGNAEIKSLSSILKINGIIDVPPQNMVSVSAPLGGYLKSTKLLPGMPVSRGEVIAYMEDPQYIQIQQDYLIAGAKMNMLLSEYERQKELNKTKAGSDKILQQSEAEYRSQRINQRALAEKLRLIGINPEALNENTLSRAISIYSPISGFVSKVNVNIGKYVNATDVLFELVNPTDIHLNLKVYEKDLDLVQIGQKVKAWTNSKPDIKYNCDVILIGKNIGSERTVEMHCHFEKYDKVLVPGMYMNAEVEVKNESDFTLPENAIINAGEKNYCFIQTAPRNYKLLEIKRGISQNGSAAFTIPGNSEIKNLQFVIEGSHNLWMALKNVEE